MADKILHLHEIGRGLGFHLGQNIPAGGFHRRLPLAVKILSPQRQGFDPQHKGRVIHHPLNPDQPLRAAKTAIGGGALGIGFQPVAFNADIGQMIAIVGMQHRTVRHRKA